MDFEQNRWWIYERWGAETLFSFLLHQSDKLIHQRNKTDDIKWLIETAENRVDAVVEVSKSVGGERFDDMTTQI